MGPELAPGVIVCINENAAARNPFGLQRIGASLDQRASDALFLKTNVDREVVEVTAASIVTAHYGTNDLAGDFDDTTEAGVTIEKFSDSFA
jgi:hypothetical protein